MLKPELKTKWEDACKGGLCSSATFGPFELQILHTQSYTLLLNSLPRDVVEALSPEVLRMQLDKVLDNFIQVFS